MKPEPTVDSNRDVTKPNRREFLRIGSASLALPLLAGLPLGCAPSEDGNSSENDTADKGGATESKISSHTGADMKVQYLEIVSPDAEAICASYQQMLGLEFGEPNAGFGNARIADLPTGGMLGVRAPLREDEGPVVRPYYLVEDIDASVAKAAEAGAEIAMPPMEMPGHGKFAVFIHGGIEQGFWQL